MNLKKKKQKLCTLIRINLLIQSETLLRASIEENRMLPSTSQTPRAKPKIFMISIIT